MVPAGMSRQILADSDGVMQRQSFDCFSEESPCRERRQRQAWPQHWYEGLRKMQDRLSAKVSPEPIQLAACQAYCLAYWTRQPGL